MENYKKFKKKLDTIVSIQHIIVMAASAGVGIYLIGKYFNDSILGGIVGVLFVFVIPCWNYMASVKILKEIFYWIEKEKEKEKEKDEKVSSLTPLK